MTPKEATDKNVITKQVVINTPTSARLLPITADEKVIDEIQQALDELEELKKSDASKELDNIKNYCIQECYDELTILENPKLPPEQSMYHDISLDVIASRKQRIKKRLLQFEQSIVELEELKKDVNRYFELELIEEPSSEQFVEFLRLKNKLLKVGEKDE